MEGLLEMLFIPAHRVLTTSRTLQCKEWVVWKVADGVCSGLTALCWNVLFPLFWILFWRSSCTGWFISLCKILLCKSITAWRKTVVVPSICSECRLILCLVFKNHKCPFILNLDTAKHTLFSDIQQWPQVWKPIQKPWETGNLLREVGRRDWRKMFNLHCSKASPMTYGSKCN